MAFAAAIPAIMSIAGTAVAVYGVYQQGQAQKSAADYNARLAGQNAVIARQQADLRARQQDRLNRMRLGTIRATQGAAGGAQDEGSVLDIIADNAMQGELQRQEIMYEGELKARGYQGTAALDRMQGKAAGKAAAIGAGSALLGGASKTAGLLKRG